MNTPKTDAFVMSKYASRDALYKEMRESHRQLETQVQELREALEYCRKELQGISPAVQYAAEVLDRTK